MLGREGSLGLYYFFFFFILKGLGDCGCLIAVFSGKPEADTKGVRRVQGRIGNCKEGASCSRERQFSKRATQCCYLSAGFIHNACQSLDCMYLNSWMLVVA